MKVRRSHRGFTLAEVLIALVLVALSMTALMLAFTAGSRLGVLARRQASAMSLARSMVSTLSLADWNDARLANSNTSNDGDFADSAGRFAQTAIPTGANAPDTSIGNVTAFGDVFGETYQVYVNVSSDTDGTGLEQGRDFAVIVRFKVGTTWARALA